MYVINKKSTRYGKTRTLYYLVESYRENGKPKRKTLLSLGEYRTAQEMFNLLGQREITLKNKIAEKVKIWEDPSTQQRSKRIVRGYIEIYLRQLQELQAKMESARKFL